MAVQTIFYSDIDLSFNTNIYGDISKKINEKSIAQSVKNIVLSSSKPFQPAFGPRIKAMLFQLRSTLTDNLLQDEIVSYLQMLEPRITNISVKVNDYTQDPNEISITIYYKIVDFDEVYSVNVLLEKVR